MWGMLKLSRIHVMNFTRFIYHMRRIELRRRENFIFYAQAWQLLKRKNLFNILPLPMANGQINLRNEMLGKFIEIPVQRNKSQY